MKRLTEKDWKDKCEGYPWNVHPVKDIDDLPYYKKLAAYEDAEEQGLLLKLPCKVGDKIFLDFAGFGKDIDKFIVKDFHLDCFEDGETILFCDYESNDRTLSGQIDVMEFGKTVFLKKSEAEAKLKELNEMGDVIMNIKESDFTQDNDNKQIECIKVSEIDTIVSMMNGKPYYEIKYKKVGEDYYHIGYSSYNLDFVLEWKRKCFSLVRERKSVAGWIPVSKRLPNEDEFIKSYRRNKYAAEFIVMIKGANRPTTLYFTHDGWWTDNMKDRYDVTAWMPLPEPYREGELPKQTNADRIRSMTDEELAIHMMCPNEMGLAEIECDKSDSCNCYECLLKWLRAESEE